MATKRKSIRKASKKKNTDKVVDHPQVSEKEQARAARHEAKKNDKAEPQVEKSVPEKSDDRDVKHTITKPLDDLYKYKLQVLNKEFEDAKAAVAGPIRDVYQQELLTKIKAAVKADPKCQQAHKERAKCINELLDKLTEDLPEGYAISMISPEKGEYSADYKPDQAKQRLSEQLA